MGKLVALFLLSLAVTAVSAQLKKVCNADNIKLQLCSFGYGAAGCIPEVRGLTFDWKDVKSRSFIVNWKRLPSAKCYYLEVLRDYTTFPFKTISCFKGTEYKVTGLTPWQIYGFRVSAVTRQCKRGRPSPSLRIKAFWAPTAAPRSTPKPTYRPKVGKCGRRFFTCDSGKKKCIAKRKWCDKILQCTDGSDERKCPGGCNEIDVDLKNGNYSCSRWGSPGSYCFFDCKEPYTRDGPKHTECIRGRKKWSNPIPICRLQRTGILKVIPDETTDTSATVEWEPVDGADKYAFQAIEQVAEDKDEVFTKTELVNATECCKIRVSDLMPKVEYMVSMWAIDADGQRGIESFPVFFKTVPYPISILKGSPPI